MEEPALEQTIAESQILEVLAPFSPRLAGTLPFGIGIAFSDSDILYKMCDAAAFSRSVLEHFADSSDFRLVPAFTHEAPGHLQVHGVRVAVRD